MKVLISNFHHNSSININNTTLIHATTHFAKGARGATCSPLDIKTPEPGSGTGFQEIGGRRRWLVGNLLYCGFESTSDHYHPVVAVVGWSLKTSRVSATVAPDNHDKLSPVSVTTPPQLQSLNIKQQQNSQKYH